MNFGSGQRTSGKVKSLFEIFERWRNSPVARISVFLKCAQFLELVFCSDDQINLRQQGGSPGMIASSKRTATKPSCGDISFSFCWREAAWSRSLSSPSSGGSGEAIQAAKSDLISTADHRWVSGFQVVLVSMFKKLFRQLSMQTELFSPYKDFVLLIQAAKRSVSSDGAL